MRTEEARETVRNRRRIDDVNETVTEASPANFRPEREKAGRRSLAVGSDHVVGTRRERGVRGERREKRSEASAHVAILRIGRGIVNAAGSLQRQRFRSVSHEHGRFRRTFHRRPRLRANSRPRGGKMGA
jgi:hypothetical protein